MLANICTTTRLPEYCASDGAGRDGSISAAIATAYELTSDDGGLSQFPEQPEGFQVYRPVFFTSVISVLSGKQPTALFPLNS